MIYDVMMGQQGVSRASSILHGRAGREDDQIRAGRGGTILRYRR